MGSADQALVGLSHCLKEELLTIGVKFSEHIIEQKQRRIAAALANQLQFSQLQR